MGIVGARSFTTVWCIYPEGLKAVAFHTYTSTTMNFSSIAAVSRRRALTSMPRPPYRALFSTIRLERRSSHLGSAKTSASRSFIDISLPGRDPMIRSFSSTSKEEKSGISGWMERRKDKQEQEKYLEQMERLADMDELTLENYKKELETGLSGWGTNISFLQTKEVKVAKEVVNAITSFIDVMGPKANVDDLNEMSRLQRLKVATSTNKTVEEISTLLSQIQNMDIMQRVLRKRKLEGKSIPTDPNSLQHVIKMEATAVMTKSQRKVMKSRSMEMARKMARRK